MLWGTAITTAGILLTWLGRRQRVGAEQLHDLEQRALLPEQRERPFALIVPVGTTAPYPMAAPPNGHHGDVRSLPAASGPVYAWERSASPTTRTLMTTTISPTIATPRPVTNDR